MFSIHSSYGKLIPFAAAILTFLPFSQLAVAEVPPTVTPDDEARCRRNPHLFGHRGWRGREFSLENSYEDFYNSNFDDDAGSLCVTYGWRVTLYGGKFSKNPLLEITGDDASEDPTFFNFFEGSGLNNVVSSAVVERRDFVNNQWVLCDQYYYGSQDNCLWD
jgi:hypothetical protein